MKTLVIHPDDRSTDCLKDIYKGKDWTIITDHNICRSRGEISKQIKKHDRIIMMGHGYPQGLFFTCINPTMVYLLREKECVCIWCNADKFVRKYGLKGFYTGMFISEVDEARIFGIKIDQADVSYSNYYFSNLMNSFIDSENILNEIKSSYTDDENPVIKFNNDRLYYRDEESLLAERDLDDEDLDPAGGHGLHSHI
jgi:hypothetical protein